MCDDHGYQAILNNRLHLLLVACCYVGQEPNSFLQEKIGDNYPFVSLLCTLLIFSLLWFRRLGKCSNAP